MDGEGTETHIMKNGVVIYTQAEETTNSRNDKQRCGRDSTSSHPRRGEFVVVVVEDQKDAIVGRSKLWLMSKRACGVSTKTGQGWLM